MFVARRKSPRVLVLAGSVAGALALLAPAVAGAVSAYHWQAMMLDARVRAYAESRVGYGASSAGAFGMRHDWQTLRGNRGSTSSARQLVSRTRPSVRTPMRFRPTARVGGLVRRLTGVAPGEHAERTISFDHIFSPAAGAGAAPSFGGLRDGAPSFSFGLGR